jgi:hypothetical protein
MDGAGLSDGERVDIVRRATEIDQDVALRVQANVGRKLYVNVEEYAGDLQQIFKPNHHGYREAIKGKTQRHD